MWVSASAPSCQLGDRRPAITRTNSPRRFDDGDVLAGLHADDSSISDLILELTRGRCAAEKRDERAPPHIQPQGSGEGIVAL
jgi:hypothetical protein